MVKHPQLMSSVLHYIEVMHGMASAGARTSVSNSRVYGQLAAMLPALPLILRAYGRESPAHVLAILRLYHHIADCMLDGMSTVHLDHFLTECATLYSTYFSCCHFGATATAAAIADTQRHEQYQETLACLKLLCCLIEWMRADSENARGAATFWRLLDLVLPSIFAAPDLMQHRKLALALFYTIHSMFELAPMVRLCLGARCCYARALLSRRRISPIGVAIHTVNTAILCVTQLRHLRNDSSRFDHRAPVVRVSRDALDLESPTRLAIRHTWIAATASSTRAHARHHLARVYDC